MHLCVYSASASPQEDAGAFPLELFWIRFQVPPFAASPSGNICSAAWTYRLPRQPILMQVFPDPFLFYLSRFTQLGEAEVDQAYKLHIKTLLDINAVVLLAFVLLLSWVTKYKLLEISSLWLTSTLQLFNSSSHPPSQLSSQTLSP